MDIAIVILSVFMVLIALATNATDGISPMN
jgi:hypothetical protein